MDIDFLHLLKQQFCLEIICLAREVQSHKFSQILVSSHFARPDAFKVFELDHSFEVEFRDTNLESPFLDVSEDCVCEYGIVSEVQTEENLS